jgi:hypothetical protein
LAEGVVDGGGPSGLVGGLPGGVIKFGSDIGDSVSNVCLLGGGTWSREAVAHRLCGTQQLRGALMFLKFGKDRRVVLGYVHQQAGLIELQNLPDGIPHHLLRLCGSAHQSPVARHIVFQDYHGNVISAFSGEKDRVLVQNLSPLEVAFTRFQVGVGEQAIHDEGVVVPRPSDRERFVQ